MSWLTILRGQSCSPSSPQFFDPIRAFFVRAKVEGIWHLEGYPIIKWLRSKVNSTGFSFSSFAKGEGDAEADGQVGKDAWKDRVEAEKSVVGWLKESPGTLILHLGTDTSYLQFNSRP